ncbi:MAG: hypothetical protein NTW85_16755 [Methylococcales bacterium]|nr:hypothetical protein [Methylococcales bacterium]
MVAQVTGIKGVGANCEIVDKGTNASICTPTQRTTGTDAPPKILSVSSSVSLYYIREVYGRNLKAIQNVADYADYAVMANNTYYEDSVVLPYYIKLRRSYEDDILDFRGFGVAVFESSKTGITTIAFRGSDNLVNWIEDAANIAERVSMGGLTPLSFLVSKIFNIFDKALEYAKGIGAKKLNFTGHSLGGALAAYVGAIIGGDVITFNSLHMGEFKKIELAIGEVMLKVSGLPRAESKIVHFKSVHDPVTFLFKDKLKGDLIVVYNETAGNSLTSTAGHNMTSLMKAMVDVQSIVAEVGSAKKLVSWQLEPYFWISKEY